MTLSEATPSKGNGEAGSPVPSHACTAQAIALGRDPRKFLASALDQPNIAAVDSAMEQLVAIRAISNSDPEDCPTMLAIGEAFIVKPPRDPNIP